MTETTCQPLLEVCDLTVAFGRTRVIEDASFAVAPGKTLAVVGESGSGKSLASLSIMGLAPFLGARIEAGRILFRSGSGVRDLATVPEAAMRNIRGREIAMVFQEPMTSLNPVFTIGDQVGEVLRLHEGLSRAAAAAEARHLLDMVRLPDATDMLTRYPHQLSGGMRQRVVIAMALACRPKLLIADEPTTALDVTVQAQILDLLRQLQRDLGTAIVFITHDMGVVAEMADEVVVMRAGRVIEHTPAPDLFERPAQDYTRHLLAAVPRLGSMAGTNGPRAFEAATTAAQSSARVTDKPLLRVRDLVVRFDVRKTWAGRVTHRVHAVEGVGFDIRRGETLALVGESGSGKSTIGRTIQQLQRQNSGSILIDGCPTDAMDAAGRQTLRQRVQYVFQDPYASLDPRKTVGFSIAEPIRTHGLAPDEAAVHSRVGALLERVGLRAEHAARYPHQFSGGQRQRICIARALASEPDLIIADEALSALDVSVQAQIIDLFLDLQAERGLAYLFISHDLAVVERVSHRVAVLYLGRIVEIGTRRQVFEAPAHSYTRRLLAAVPVVDPWRRRAAALPGREIPSPMRPASFVPPPLVLHEIAPGHLAAREDEARRVPELARGEPS